MPNTMPASSPDLGGGTALADDAVGFRIKMIGDALERNANRSLKEFDLTFSQMRLLAVLVEEGGHAAQRRLELVLGVSHPTVVGLVRRLEAKGYVWSYPGVEDARMKFVAVTERGRETVGRAERHRGEMEGAMVRGMTDGDVAALKRLLDRVVENLVDAEADGA